MEEITKGASDLWEEKIVIVRKHFEDKGYRVHSGLQFGSELVLYADDPGSVHSDFCIHVIRDGKFCPVLFLHSTCYNVICQIIKSHTFVLFYFFRWITRLERNSNSCSIHGRFS